MKRTLRSRLITAGAVMGAAGLIFAGGLPAVAEDGLETATPPDGIIFGENGLGEEQDDPTKITPEVEVTGWPDGHVFYAGETVTLNVHVDPGVVGAPSVEGMLAGLSYEDEVLAYSEIDEEGNALVSVRPIITGTLHLTPFVAGEGAFNYAAGVGGDIEVDPVPVEASIWPDWVDEAGATVGYGGETLQVNGYIEPFCVDDEDDAASDECYATYGVPTGTLSVMRDGEAIGEAVVAGPAADAAFADVNADLSQGERPEWTFASFTVPSILLGSPDSFEVTAEFESDNWFTSEVAGPFTVEVAAFQTELDLLIDGEWRDDDPTRVNASEVLLSAYFEQGDRTGAPPTGTVEFFANDESIGEMPVDDDGERADITWAPIEGGDYVLRAVYTPDSLNHLGSATPEYSVQVTIPPAPNPTPDDSGSSDDTQVDDTAADTSKPASTLATTGDRAAEFAGIAGIALLLTGAVALTLARRTRA